VTVGVSISAISVLYPVLSYINQIASGTEIEKHIPSLIKALGIALAVQITADSCKDAGEETLASRVYLFGQAEILIISIPIIKSLLSLCGDLIK
jgi:stage III sporulation protein AD